MIQKFRDQSYWSKGGSIAICLCFILLFLFAFFPPQLLTGSFIYDVVFLPTVALDYVGLLEIIPSGPFGAFAFFFVCGFSYIAGGVIGFTYGKFKNRNKDI